MQYPSPLIEGQFLKRYKRFFADVEIIEGGKRKTVVAHVGNTGSLRGVCDAPNPCRIAFHNNPERKLKYSLEHVKPGKSWVGVNTRLANDLAAEAFQSKLWPHWSHLIDMQREFKLNDQTRLDFRFVDKKGRPHFVEVKSVSMATRHEEGLQAQFPDAVTTRGQKHLNELMSIVKRRESAELLFIVQRNDVAHFGPAALIDPEYAELLRKAERAGVTISAFAVDLTRERASVMPEPTKISL